jgi:hypothetical protein
MGHEHSERSFSTPDSDATRVLSDAEIERFIRDGFVKIEAAFGRDLADQGRSILWRDTGCAEDDPTTWRNPVIRLGMYGQEPFAQAANTAILHRAFNQLVGPKRWLPRMTLGTFPIRFPSLDDPGDAGWHIDTSFPPENVNSSDFLNWRVNMTSKGRALLMLFLFSDVGENDAPTRIRGRSAAGCTAPVSKRVIASHARRARRGESEVGRRIGGPAPLQPGYSAEHDRQLLFVVAGDPTVFFGALS